MVIIRTLRLWVAAAVFLTISSEKAFPQLDTQRWLDSLSRFVEAYDQLLEQTQRYVQNQEIAVKGSDASSSRLASEEPSHECLANRLLAEEYYPYDFDIRETMWCKRSLDGEKLWIGSKTSDESQTVIDAECEAQEPALLDIEIQLAAEWDRLVPHSVQEWARAIQEQAWKGFCHEMDSTFHQLTDHFQPSLDALARFAARYHHCQWEIQLAQAARIRHTFGPSIIPRQVTVTPGEYARAVIEFWNELRSSSKENGILVRSTPYPITPLAEAVSSGELVPLYDLMTSITRILPILQR